MLCERVPTTLPHAVSCRVPTNITRYLHPSRCINRNPVGQWETLTRVKARIVEFLKDPASTATLGVREAALKFAQRVIQVQTRGVSDPRVRVHNPIHFIAALTLCTAAEYSGP